MVTAEGDGIKGGNKWLPDRPELTFESLSGLFADRLYRIPASGGAQKHFRPAISQFEDYPGGRKTPNDILSAARLSEYGVLGVMDQHKPPERGYAAGMAHLQKVTEQWKIPAYVTKPHANHLEGAGYC